MNSSISISHYFAINPQISFLSGSSLFIILLGDFAGFLNWILLFAVIGLVFFWGGGLVGFF